MVEVLVVVSIATASILAVMNVAQKSIFISRQTLHATQASYLLEEGAEAIRIIRDNGWSNISGLNSATTYYPVFSGGTWILSTTSSQVGIFTRQINITNVNRDNTTNDISVAGTNDSGTKLITVTVSWPEGTSTLTKILSFYILDIFS